MENTKMKDPRSSERGLSLLFVLLVLVFSLLIVFLGISFRRWEGQAPILRFDREFKALGRSPNLSLTIEDAGSGLSRVSVSLRQKDQLIPLVEERYEGPS